MDNAKRASMREGPLAALFRRTEIPGRPAAEGEETPAEPPPRASQAPPAVSAEPRGATGAPSQQELVPPASESAEATVPSPKERLRNVFSAEIPANMMDRQAPRADRRARAWEPEPARAPAGVGSAQAVIRVVGVGGSGVNAVNRMVEAEIAGVEFLAVNTDIQSLQQTTADVTVRIGEDLTRGLGSGSDADVGRQAAMDDYDRVKALLKGSDMIFIAAGEGGGTGTGGAPIVARIAREVGALTVAIVTKPFGFEGTRRAEQAERGIEALRSEVDTLIVVPNNRLLTVLDKQTSMVDAFQVADDVLRQGVQGISDLVTLPGLINLDFADVCTIMREAGSALLGIGMGVGENRALDAAAQAIASPLLETSVDGARSILLSITGGEDLSLWEVNEAAKAVSAAAHPDANIIFGAMVDEKLDEQVWVTVVATGYGERPARRPEKPGLEEPAGDLRVKRNPRPPAPAAGRRSTLVVDDIPEFIPNF